MATSEVHKVLIHEYNDSTYLILHLFNFHPTEGSYEKGNLRTVGYNESEIRIINLNSKKVIKSQYFGEYNFEGAFEILGATENQIWIYSMANKSGLHALNLHTLERDISQANVYSKMKTWTGRFYEPEWNKISEYYSYNQYSNELIITNYKKQSYSVNTISFDVNEIEFQSQNKADFLWKVVYELQDTLDLYNEYIYINNIKQLPDFHFIEGNFLIEQNAKIQYEQYKKRLITYQTLLDQTNDKLMRIRVKQGSEVYTNLIAKKELLESKIANTKTNLKAIEQSVLPDKMLIRTSDNAFYVLHRDNEKKTSTIAITKVNQSKQGLTVEWKTPISNMYYNISAVKDLPEFKKYFKNNVPDPSFYYIQQFNNQLLIIYLLQVCIIDTQTGEITWQTKL